MKINNMKDLREERRLIRMEIRATEHLLLDTLHRSKKDAMGAIAGQILPDLSPMSILSGASSVLQHSAGKKARWMKFLLPLLPVVLRVFDKKR